MREPDVADDGQTSCTFFVHGVRHIDGASARIDEIRPGEPLLLRDEPANRVNTKAILVAAGDEQALGYVPDLLVEYVRSVREVHQPTITVRQVNERNVPPNLRLLVHLTGRLPTSHRPFTGPDWQTQADYLATDTDHVVCGH